MKNNPDKPTAAQLKCNPCKYIEQCSKSSPVKCKKESEQDVDIKIRTCIMNHAKSCNSEIWKEQKKSLDALYHQKYIKNNVSTMILLAAANDETLHETALRVIIKMVLSPEKVTGADIEWARKRIKYYDETK